MTDYAETLRQAAAFVDAHPEFKWGKRYGDDGGCDLFVATTFVAIRAPFGYNDKTTAHSVLVARKVRRAIGGKWAKTYDGSNVVYTSADYTWGGAPITVKIDRSAVCKRVVTGYETVTLPARATEEVVKTPVYGWECA